jgi:hypothetical protein
LARDAGVTALWANNRSSIAKTSPLLGLISSVDYSATISRIKSRYSASDRKGCRVPKSSAPGGKPCSHIGIFGVG